MKSEITSNIIIVYNYNLLSEKNGVDDILASLKEAAKCKRFLRFQDPTDLKENARKIRKRKLIAPLVRAYDISLLSTPLYIAARYKFLQKT